MIIIRFRFYFQSFLFPIQLLEKYFFQEINEKEKRSQKATNPLQKSTKYILFYYRRSKLGNTLLYIIRIPMVNLSGMRKRFVSVVGNERNTTENFTGLLLCICYDEEVKQFFFIFFFETHQTTTTNTIPATSLYVRPENLMMVDVMQKLLQRIFSLND